MSDNRYSVKFAIRDTLPTTYQPGALFISASYSPDYNRPCRVQPPAGAVAWSHASPLAKRPRLPTKSASTGTFAANCYAARSKAGAIPGLPPTITPMDCTPTSTARPWRTAKPA